MRTGWRALPSEVRVLVVARAVNRLGAFTLPFLTVTLVRVFDASVVQAGYLLAAFGAATIPSRLFGGRLADRVGGRATVVLGLVATALAQLALAAAPTLAVAGVSVVALGLAFEVYEPPSQSIVADTTTPDQRPAAYGLLAGAMAAAGMAAGLLAASVAGVDLRWLFVVDAITCLACAVLVAVRLPRGTPGTASARPSTWRDPRLRVMLGAGTVFAVVYLQITIALPLTLTARGLPVGRIGILLSVAAATTVLCQPVLQWPWLRSLDDFAAMTFGYLVLAGGLLATGFAASLPAFVAATVAWSVGDLVLLGRAYSVVASLAPPGARGGYLATYGTSWGLAAVVAPLVGTQLLATGGPRLVWSVLALACGLLAAAQPVVRRQVARPAPPAPPTRALVAPDPRPRHMRRTWR